MALAFKLVAVAASRAIWDKKGEDVLLLHVAKTSPITDYLLLATALAPSHMESLEVEVRKVLKGYNIFCLHKARPASDNWRVMDFGGLLVHIMTAEARMFYSLEKLYPDAPRVKWLPPPAAPAKTAAKKRNAAHARAR